MQKFHDETIQLRGLLRPAAPAASNTRLEYHLEEPVTAIGLSDVVKFRQLTTVVSRAIQYIDPVLPEIWFLFRQDVQ